MNADCVSSLIDRLKLEPHVEGGAFRELYRENGRPEGRPASGVIYYALRSNEHSDFHVIDCDKYWLYHAGDSLELWMIEPDGRVHTQMLGIREGEEPCILLKAGVIFGAKPVKGASEATLLSCITVPEFMYEHYRILPREEVLASWPEAAPFWEE